MGNDDDRLKQDPLREYGEKYSDAELHWMLDQFIHSHQRGDIALHFEAWARLWRMSPFDDER